MHEKKQKVVKLETRAAADTYLAKRLSPGRSTPSGLKSYKYTGLKKLDIVYPKRKR